MSLTQKFVSQVLFPAQEAVKGHSTLKVYRELERSQWFEPAKIAALQVENLRQFLVKIKTTVPYYTALFSDIGFDPAALTSVADLQHLPLTDKATIRSNLEELKAGDAAGLKRFNTGGSSGEPLVFFLGNERVSHDVAAKRRATRWWDVDIGDREIVVWGSPIELGAQDRVRLFRDRCFRTELLSAFEMSDTNLALFVARIRAFRPRMLFGYPSSLALIAEYARTRKLDLDGLGIRVAFVTSEKLYDHQRMLIEEVFGCPVANGYGGRDAGFIAHQCPEGSLHITAEDLVVEIVDKQGNVLPPGESGEIVITHLFTSEFPFVRYRTGDIGVLGTSACQCGRGLPILASVEGRSTDFVVTADGAVIHGLALIYILRDVPEIEAFRIVQESIHHTRVELVTKQVNQQLLATSVVAQFRARLGQDVEVEVAFLESLTPEKSGKFRYVISKVAQGS